jgi:hypothetical protein
VDAEIVYYDTGTRPMLSFRNEGEQFVPEVLLRQETPQLHIDFMDVDPREQHSPVRRTRSASAEADNDVETRQDRLHQVHDGFRSAKYR